MKHRSLGSGCASRAEAMGAPRRGELLLRRGELLLRSQDQIDQLIVAGLREIVALHKE